MSTTPKTTMFAAMNATQVKLAKAYLGDAAVALAWLLKKDNASPTLSRAARKIEEAIKVLDGKAEAPADCLHCRWPPGTVVDVAYGADDAPQWERGTVVVNPEIRVRFDNDDSPLEIVCKESRVRRHVEEPADGQS